MTEHAHSHPEPWPGYAHQFDDPQQQYNAAALGMWTFLVTEILFFGGLFAGYTVYRWSYEPSFAEASHHLDVVLGTINTFVLLCSSLTMALAVREVQLSRPKSGAWFLAGTIILGTVFLAIKVVEYQHKFHEHLVPGPRFAIEIPTDHPGVLASHVELFFSFYFAMTGLHALHMIIGIGLLAWLILETLRGRFSAAYFTPVEMTGLYWHFVDIVWVFLFPLLYLVGPRP